MNTIIKAEGVGKKFILSHHQKQPYYALRDVMADTARRWGKKIFHPLTSHSSPSTGSSNEDFWALKNVSFEVNEGEVVGIIGRNGAGKSTLLKILSRITEPTEGRVRIRGRVGSLLEVGTGFHPELTGRENIFLNGAILGMTRAEIKKKYDEIIDFAEIEKFLDTPVKRYSSGMYVRLAFAVAANLEPEILLVDEVLAVGDAQFQKKCLGKMGDVAKGGRTVLFVSHNLTAIRSFCSRALLLRNGILVADEKAAEAVSKYMDDRRETSLKREWLDEKTAPQNMSAILKKINICDAEGNEVDEIYTDSTFNIEVSYTTKRKGAFVGFTIIIYDSENNCILSSINNHETNWYGKAMPAGNYRSICNIPANLFNNGLFNVSLNLFGKGYTDIYSLKEVLKLEILDGTTVRGDYFGGWSGVIRPQLKWITEVVK